MHRRAQAPLALGGRGSARAATPAEIARAYAGAGAAALSVLTDEPFFGGSLDDLRARARGGAGPDPAQGLHGRRYQVLEARAAGADAILLIVRALADAEITRAARRRARGRPRRAGRGARRAELDRALALGATIVGINNRDLRTFTIDRELAIRLRALVAGRRVVVAESGIRDAADVERLRAAGVDAMLVGETLMRAPDPGAALRGAAGARLAMAGARPFLIKICGVTTRRGRGAWRRGRRRARSASTSGRLEALRRRRGGGARRARGDPARRAARGRVRQRRAAEVERARASSAWIACSCTATRRRAAFAAIPRASLIRAVRVRDEASFADDAAWRAGLLLYDAFVDGFGGGGVAAPWPLIARAGARVRSCSRAA